MMKNYLKDADLSIQDGSDVKNIMRDMMSVLLEGALDGELDDSLGYNKYDYKNYSGTLVKTKIDKFLNVSGSRHCSIEQQCREVALCWRDVPDG